MLRRKKFGKGETRARKQLGHLHKETRTDYGMSTIPWSHKGRDYCASATTITTASYISFQPCFDDFILHANITSLWSAKQYSSRPVPFSIARNIFDDCQFFDILPLLYSIERLRFDNSGSCASPISKRWHTSAYIVLFNNCRKHDYEGFRLSGATEKSVNTLHTSQMGRWCHRTHGVNTTPYFKSYSQPPISVSPRHEKGVLDMILHIFSIFRQPSTTISYFLCL